ncbi:hypothetical protein HWV62_4501 [Athelia sp. TMB]|nr:hypothetical protein HWV62_4501 [Athelia sp. TMB]
MEVDWIWTCTLTRDDDTATPWYYGLPGCSYEDNGRDDTWSLWSLIISSVWPLADSLACRLPFGIIEIVFLSFTLVKMWRYGELNRTVTVLARDSIIYFVIVFLSVILKEIMGQMQDPINLKTYANFRLLVDILLTSPARLLGHYSA